MTDRRPEPARITLALNLRGLQGPQVDRACGVEEPTVDMWESGALVPTVAQVKRLTLLTGFPAAYFYRPPPPPREVRVFVCTRGRRAATPPRAPQAQGALW